MTSVAIDSDEAASSGLTDYQRAFLRRTLTHEARIAAIQNPHSAPLHLKYLAADALFSVTARQFAIAVLDGETSPDRWKQELAVARRYLNLITTAFIGPQ